MNIINIIICSLIKASKEERADQLKFFSDQGCSFDEIKVKNKHSVSVETEEGKEIPFSDWLIEMPADKIKKIALGIYKPSNVLPEHILAAFVDGGAKPVLQIQCDNKVQTFGFQTEYSPKYKITSENLTEIINLQKNAEFFWSVLENVIIDHFELNNERTENIRPVKNNLAKIFEQHRYTVDLMLSDWSNDLQVEGYAFGHPFVIPESFQDLFVSYKNDSFGLFGDEQKELVHSQPVDKNDDEEIDERRLEFRQNFQINGAYLQESDLKWVNDKLKLIQISDNFFELDQESDLKELKKKFVDLLKKTEVFAKEEASLAGYLPRFKMAQIPLSEEWVSDSDPDFISSLKKITEKKFGKDFSQSVSDSIYIENYLKMNMSKVCVGVLIAYNLTNIFGGMGSWNDAYLSDELKQKRYEKLTADLYESRQKAYLGALVNFLQK